MPKPALKTSTSALIDSLNLYHCSNRLSEPLPSPPKKCERRFFSFSLFLPSPPPVTLVPTLAYKACLPLPSLLDPILLLPLTFRLSKHHCFSSFAHSRFPFSSCSHQISTNLPPGYVWREAYDGDHVCVPPDSRSAAAADNAAAASRVQPEGGPFGPDTCKDGFVWREAQPSDHVCVTVATRTQTSQDNQEAPYRVVCSCTLPLYTYTQKWQGTAPFCDGSCPEGWHELRRASSGDGCDKSKKGLCVNCLESFGSSCLTGSKALCEDDIASVIQA